MATDPRQHSAGNGEGDDPAPMRNPFRSEADAFRLLLLIGGGVAAIVAASVLGGALLGVPVALVLGTIAARATYRWVQAGISAPGRGAGPPGE